MTRVPWLTGSDTVCAEGSNPEYGVIEVTSTTNATRNDSAANAALALRESYVSPNINLPAVEMDVSQHAKSPRLPRAFVAWVPVDLEARGTS